MLRVFDCFARSARPSAVPAAAALALALAGCAQTPGGGSATGVSAAPAAPAPAPAPVIVPPLASLNGMTPASLTSLLGEPTLLRREQDAQVWKYATTDCVLFLFLYPTETDAREVMHFEAAPRDADRTLGDDELEPFLESCFADAVRAHATARPAGA
jgi:hypothetical protein